MKKTIPTVLISCALASVVDGAIFSVNEVLSPANTNPDTSATAGPDAIGSFTGSYDTDTGILSYTMTWSGLSSPIMGSPGAHIHGDAPLGTNAGILFTIIPGNSAIGTESGTTTGSFDLSTNANANEESFLGNLWYVNIHTTTNGSGELRSQLNPAPVPEPSAVLLSGLALLGLGVRRRR